MIAYVNGKFILISNSTEVSGNIYTTTHKVETSTDGGESWSTILTTTSISTKIIPPAPVSNNNNTNGYYFKINSTDIINSVAHYGDTYIAVGNEIRYSIDNGITWEFASLDPSKTLWTSIIHNGSDRFLAISSSSNISARCSNPSDWEILHILPDVMRGEWGSIVYGDGKFVIGNQSGKRIAYEDVNGIDNPWGWKWTTSPVFGADIFYLKNEFVGVGYSTLIRSANGIEWTSCPCLGLDKWVSVAYGDGVYITVSTSGSVLLSEDLIEWEIVEDIPAYSWNSIAYGNDRFVLCSSEGEILIIETE